MRDEEKVLECEEKNKNCIFIYSFDIIHRS